MVQAQTYEGTLDQIVRQLTKLPETGRYKVVVTSEEPERPEFKPEFISFGMFPQLQTLTEEDFKSAEWQGEDIRI